MFAWLRSRLLALHHRLRRSAAMLFARSAPHASSPEPRRVLLVLIGLIGDSIMCTPALAEARRLLPSATIHVLTTGANQQLLQNSAWADRVHVYDGPAFPWRRAERRALRDLERHLRLASLDTAVVLLGDDFVPLLCRAGISRRIGPAGSSCERLLTDRYELGSVRAWGPEARLGALRCLGLHPLDARPGVPTPLESGALAVLRAHGIAAQSGFLLLHPFGSTPNRNLGLRKSAELAAMLAERCQREVLVIGGPADREAAQTIATLCARADVHAAAGHFSLAQTLFLMQQAGAVVTTDSGPLHMAGALQRPTVGLFRAIRPEYAGLYPSVAPLFWAAGGACLPGCTWDSWYGCRVSPCRQLDGIANCRIVEAAQNATADLPLGHVAA